MKNKYIIPLRKECMKVPLYSRTRKAVKAVKKFVQKHAKTDDVRIGKYLNLKLWENGNRNPPHKVEVVIEKVEEEKDKQKVSYVKVELFGAPKEEKKKKEKKSLLSRIKGDKTEEKAEEKKPEAAKKEDKPAAKEEKPAVKEEKDLHEDSKKEEEIKKEEKALEKESKELQKEKLPKPQKPKAKPQSQKEMQKPREAKVVSETGK